MTLVTVMNGLLQKSGTNWGASPSFKGTTKKLGSFISRAWPSVSVWVIRANGLVLLVSWDLLLLDRGTTKRRGGSSSRVWKYMNNWESSPDKHSSYTI